MINGVAPMESLAVIILAVMSGVIPMLAYLTIIYWMDRYEREPWWMVSLVFLWGGVGGALFGCVINSTIISLLSTLPGAGSADWVGAVVVAPLVEEVTKILPLFVLLLLRHFDNQTDGLIYGAACGLGFAMTENIFYYYQVGSASGLSVELFRVIAIRTCFTAIVHSLASASWGFWLGLGRYRKPAWRWIVFPLLGYASAISIHAFWNGSVTYASFRDSPEIQFQAYVVIALLGVFMFGLTQVSLFLEHRIIKRFLAHEAKSGVLPEEHAAIIPYWLKRTRKGWLDKHIDRERYIRAATLLAFKLHQSRHASGTTHEALLADIAKYREEVRMLLARPQKPVRSGWRTPSTSE